MNTQNSLSPARLLFTILACLFVGEALVMFLMALLPSYPTYVNAVLDASILGVIILPGLYFFFYLPIQSSVEKRVQAEAKLQALNEQLEEDVQARTSELLRANEEMQGEIAERRKTEAMLKSKNQFLNEIIESLGHPFYVINAEDHTIMMANSAAIKLGCKVGHSCFYATHGRTTPCSGENHTCPLEEVKRTKEPVMVEHLHLDADGNEIHCEVYGYPVLDSDGNLVQMIEYSMDITERKKMEEQLFHSQRMEAIGTLAGGIAHDFNNILSGVFGYSELAMLEAGDNEKLRGYLGEVRGAGERAKHLIQQILTFSRGAAQDKIPLQFSYVLKEALMLLRSSIPTTIEIKKNIGCDNIIKADPTQMHQVIMNLCTNAYHAMRETGGTLGVSLTQVELSAKEAKNTAVLQEGAYLLLEVSDTGCGMDQQTQEKIFQPYFSTKQKSEGTGLGLAVVHGIIKENNGHIDLTSEPGVGTTFRIYLPIFKGRLGEEKVEEADAPFPEGSERLMFVDDEENIIRAAEKIFSQYGYTVTVFSNGVQALQEFTKEPESYDMVITDMTMPYMLGTDLAKEILGIRPEIPIVLCTGHSDLIDREAALGMGIKEYFEKPLILRDLAQTVRKVFDGAGN